MKKCPNCGKISFNIVNLINGSGMGVINGDPTNFAGPYKR